MGVSLFAVFWDYFEMNQSIRYALTICAIGLSATYLEPSFAEIGFEESSETENIIEIVPNSVEYDSSETDGFVPEESEILAEADRELISIEEKNAEEIDVEVEESQRIPLPCRIFPSASMEQ